MVERWMGSIFMLAITTVLLLCYMFNNEIKMLNSHAKSELLPQVTENTDLFEEVEVLSFGTAATENLWSLDDLRDGKTLVQKNRFFPVLLDSWYEGLDLIDERQNPVLSQELRYWDSLPSVNLQAPVGHSSNDGQISLQVDATLLGADSEKLENVHSVFQYSWMLYQQHELGNDFERLLSHLFIDTTQAGVTMILSLETLYLLQATEQAKVIVMALQNFRFTVDNLPVGWNATSDPILGSLISSYELSGEKVLLERAIELADIIIHAFDTPNGLPMVPFDIHSPLENRFPYRRSSISDLGAISTDFTRLSQLTNDPKYFNAIYRIYLMAENTHTNFDIPGLLTSFVDASGCDIASTADTNTEQGMESIYKRRYVRCLPQNKFMKPANPYKGIGKSYDWIDLDLNLEGMEEYSWESLTTWFSNLSQLAQITSSEHQQKFLKLLEHGLDAIIEHMVYEPILPKMDTKVPISKAKFVGSLRTWKTYDSLMNSNDVKIMKNLDMTSATCSLPGMLITASRLIPKSEQKYITVAMEIINGCVKLNKLLGYIPERVAVDSCAREDNCEFDEAEKRNSLQNGVYKSNDDSVSSGLHEDILDDAIKDSSKSQEKYNYETRSYSYIDAKSHLNLDLETWDFSRPLYINYWETRYRLESFLAESLFYMFRYTGDPVWREIGWELWELITNKTLDEGAKGVMKHDATNFENALINPKEGVVAPEWFGKTIKFFILLFSDGASVGNLDTWIITNKGNLFRRGM